jgi:cation:H+ antiporter
MDYVYLVGGLAVLVYGAEVLVKHAVAFANRLGVPTLIVGLTIVAFGTSAPELVVSAMASLDGKPDIAVGNVIGSNVYNVLFILGVSALVTPLVISEQLIRIDVPVMVAVSVLALILALDGDYDAIDATLLLGLLGGYTWFQIRQGRAAAQAAPPPEVTGSMPRDIVFLILGLALLVIGSHAFLDGAIGVARDLGVSELVIGLTIVAAGTSLPETATSIVAAIRGERDIAVGNVVGSNVFNILGVLGFASLIAPGVIPIAPSLVVFDLPIMIAVAIACLPVFFVRNVIARWQGGVFVAYYVLYVVYLVLATKQHDALATFDAVMLEFVLPITALTFGVVAFRKMSSRTDQPGQGES